MHLENLHQSVSPAKINLTGPISRLISAAVRILFVLLPSALISLFCVLLRAAAGGGQKDSTSGPVLL